MEISNEHSAGESTDDKRLSTLTAAAKGSDFYKTALAFTGQENQREFREAGVMGADEDRISMSNPLWARSSVVEDASDANALAFTGQENQREFREAGVMGADEDR